MLDPDIVLAAVLTAARSIPALANELGGASHINGHYFSYGKDTSLAAAIGNMSSPSILVAYLDLLGGNFSGATIWKHRLEWYIRPKNASPGAIVPPLSSGGALTVPASAPHLAWLLLNKPIVGIPDLPPGNLRQVSLLSGALTLMDTPSITHRQDENLADFFSVLTVFPEIGDDGDPE
jgi:hypothetical protein